MQNMPADLNRLAKRVDAALSKSWPKFRKKLRVFAGGHIEAALLAPAGSRAVALVCTTSGDRDIWLRIGVPHAFYNVESVVELKKVLGAILNEKALFAVSERDGAWTGTTLVPSNTLPRLERRNLPALLMVRFRRPRHLSSTQAACAAVSQSSCCAMKPMHLYIGGRRVCVLRAGPDSDFPWFAGTLERSEHFADVEHLLLPISDGRQDIRHLCTDELAACGLTTSDLVLKEEGDAEDPDFLHALVLHPDGSAQWRIGLEPLSDGDEA